MTGTAMRVAVASLVIAVVVVAALAISRDAGIGEGKALDAGAEQGSGFSSLRPGREIVVMDEILENVSDEDVVLREIRPLTTSPRAEIVRIAAGPAEEFSAAAYSTFPPVTDDTPDGECVAQVVSDVDGFVIGPGEETFVLVWLRMKAAGKALVRLGDYVYEQGGRTYQQRFLSEIEASIRPDGRRRGVFADERRCKHLAQEILWKRTRRGDH